MKRGKRGKRGELLEHTKNVLRYHIEAAMQHGREVDGKRLEIALRLRKKHEL